MRPQPLAQAETLPLDPTWIPPAEDAYRYRLPVEPAPDLDALPSRFLVEVERLGLAKLLVRELIDLRGQPDHLALVTSRPCVYGVFSGPVGGFAPRPHLCVGCLRCSTQHPEMVTVRPNPERRTLGDDFIGPAMVDAILHEAATGSVPVKGQGYRGRMGGPGWDGMWTDMSEIVRPTRDGIHGREFISTAIELGRRERHLSFDDVGRPLGSAPRAIELPLPILLDPPPSRMDQPRLLAVWSRAAERAGSLAILPLRHLIEQDLGGPHLVPLIRAEDRAGLDGLRFEPRMVEIDARGDAETLGSLEIDLRRRWPEVVVAWRISVGPGIEAELSRRIDAGAEVIHLWADYHGRDAMGRFVMDGIRSIQSHLVRDGRRDAVGLIGSGGMAAAEHVPKAILCGLDAVAVQTAPLVALQARPRGQAIDPERAEFDLPDFEVDWGAQRLVNLLAAWRDQLLEIMGAMGLREARRLRGEIGRAMFQAELEREAFAGIEGFEEAAS